MQVGTERQGIRTARLASIPGAKHPLAGRFAAGQRGHCWVAANWQDMSKVQRFAGAQALLAVCALAAAWAGLRTAAGARGAIPGALLALAGILLAPCSRCWAKHTRPAPIPGNCSPGGPCCCCPGRWPRPARRSGCCGPWSSTWPWSWLGERVFSWWGLLGATYLPALIVAGLNLVILAVWELAARRWRASTLVGPRLLAALAIGALVMSTMYTDLFIGRSYGSDWQHRLAGGHAGPGFLLSEGAPRPGHPGHAGRRRDLRLPAGRGEWLLRLEPGAWAALPLAALLMAEAGARAGCAGWPPRARRRAAADAEPVSASAGNPVDPAPPASRWPRSPARDARRRRALVCAMPAGPERLAGDAAAAVVHRLVPDRQHAGRRAGRRAGAVRGRRGRVAQRGRSVLAAVRHGDGLRRRAAGHFRNIRLTSFTNACLFVLALAVAVYVLGTDLILRFLSGLLIAGAAAG